MRTPTACQSLADVRSEIDRIDAQIIALLRIRGDYVRAAARFKDSLASVAAPERQAAMLDVRRRWAEHEGLDADFVEKLYREIVAHFIAREMAEWRDRRSG